MKSLKFFFAAFIILLILIIVGVDYQLRQTSEGKLFNSRTDIPFNKVGLLLGTTKYDGTRLLPSYIHRIDAAVELFNAGKIEQIIASSGNNDYYNHNCDSMRADLVKKGIPPNSIILDTGGKRTLYSIIRAKQIFRLDSVTVITQKQHSRRALYMADKKDLHAIAYIAKDDPSFNLHERIASLLMFYDLVTGRKP